MKSRSKLFSHFTAFCAEIKTQFHVPIQILRSDNAKAFLWGGGNLERKPHLVNWKTVCLEKRSGGLGVRSLSKMNKLCFVSGVGGLPMRGILFGDW